MSKTKDNNADADESEGNKTRAHMVRVYEATASIKHPTATDSRFRALMSRAVNIQLTLETMLPASSKNWLRERDAAIGKEERIRRNQLVRAYEAGCGVENPEPEEAKTRAHQQTEFFRIYSLADFQDQTQTTAKGTNKK